MLDIEEIRGITMSDLSGNNVARALHIILVYDTSIAEDKHLVAKRLPTQSFWLLLIGIEECVAKGNRLPKRFVVANSS